MLFRRFMPDSVRPFRGFRFDRPRPQPLAGPWVESVRVWAKSRRGRRVRAIAIAAAAGVGLIALEIRTSWLQSEIFAATARRLSYAIGAGPSTSIRFPAEGPHDRRLGYGLQPAFVARLVDGGFVVHEQARWSPLSLRLADRGVFALHREKGQAGLLVLDRAWRPLAASRYPERIYQRFDEIPPLVVQTILFIENRTLLRDGHPRRNPAVEYTRLLNAGMDAGLRLIIPQRPVSGGSTIATQLEKVRHSPGGLTGSVTDKGTQMIAASLRAYLDGVNTASAREGLVVDYLNSLPLGAVAGYGEVAGLGDGLWAWYDADFDATNEILAGGAIAAADDPRLARQALAFRQVLGLLLAIKKPTVYLTRDPAALDARIDAFLGALAQTGIISPALRDAARDVRVETRRKVPVPAVSFAERKATDRVRAELLSTLGLHSTYDLDRLDLTVHSTLDEGVTGAVTAALQQLGDRSYARDAGLLADRLLGAGNLDRVLYSFTLYERGPTGHQLRVQADNYGGPLNLNEGTRLELGSTAKLRTLVTYLELVEALHGRYAGMPVEALGAVQPHRRDRLTRWAIDHLSRSPDRHLDAMLEASMARRYPASTGESFFTGGGLHTFRNFDGKDDGRVLTVRQAFEHSINLVFVRLMRDVVDHIVFRDPESARLVDDRTHPARPAYLERFADQEGREFLRRFHLRHVNASSADRLQRHVAAGPVTSARLAVIFRSVRPEAGPEELASFLEFHGLTRDLPEDRLLALYERYEPARWNLQDRGYLARVHPLELWLSGYLDQHPAAPLAEAIEAGATERQEAYRWLFRTTNRRAQDRAIGTLVEQDAFAVIHASWLRLGYPFASLVPSYATALGSSGDNPAALADLAGTILNGGIRQRAVRIDELVFGEGTPYHTHLRRAPDAGVRVLSPEVALLLRRALLGVVEHGTGRRLAGGVEPGDGERFEVGGKTGTGDNRFETIGPSGRTSRVVNRTAAFVFTVGDRHFGTIVAFVPGSEASRFNFTSALPVQIFRHLTPALAPLFAEVEEP
jgi:membrane peptidoglycan carboxypeptidase